MSNDYEQRMGTQKMLPLIMRMALPGVLAQLINLLYSLVDRVYIGHIEAIGTDALAGVGVTTSIILLISAFSSIVGGGGAPLAAIALGKGDRERAEKILGTGCALLIVFSLLTSLAAYLFMSPLLMLTGASAVTLPYAMDYLSIYLIGTLFVQISTGLNSFINCQGRPTIAMMSVMLGAVLNIVLDPLFIFVFQMGVKGAALATVCAQGASAFWIIRFLTSQSASLRIRKSRVRFEKPIVLAILGLGVSPFIMSATESLVGFVLNGTLVQYGDIYVSALTVMQSCMQIVSVPLTGFAQGVVPIISYNYGRRNAARVKEGFTILATLMFSINFVVMVFMILFPALPARIFTPDAALIGVVEQTMPVFLMGMTIFGMQRACQNMFVALGQTKVSLFIALLRKVLLLIPLVLILPRFMGVMGVYAGEAIADATAAMVCTGIFLFKFPKILASMRASDKK